MQLYTVIQQAIPEFVIISPLLFLLLKKCRFDDASIALFLVAYVINAIQSYGTSYMQYTHDIYGHLYYIRIIATTYTLPDLTQTSLKNYYGWQAQQPPLYYTLCAIGYHIAEYFGKDPFIGARVISRLLYCGFAIFSALTLRQIINSTTPYVIALALILFWPLAPFIGVSITNELGFYFFFSITFYYLYQWYNSYLPRYLLIALVSSGCAIASKGTGVIAIGTVIITVLVTVWKNKLTLKALTKNNYVLGGTIVLVLCLMMNFGRTAYYRLVLNEDIKWFINRHDDITRLKSYTGTELYQFLTFSPTLFARYKDRFINDEENHFFWHYLLKTLLYPSVGKNPNIPNDSSLYINITFLALIIYILITLLSFKRTFYLKDNLLPFNIAIINALVAIIVARIEVPISPQGNARYIYPIIVQLAGLYGFALLQTKASKYMYFFGVLIAVLFVINSLRFFLAQYS